MATAEGVTTDLTKTWIAEAIHSISEKVQLCNNFDSLHQALQQLYQVDYKLGVAIDEQK